MFHVNFSITHTHTHYTRTHKEMWIVEKGLHKFCVFSMCCMQHNLYFEGVVYCVAVCDMACTVYIECYTRECASLAPTTQEC